MPRSSKIVRASNEAPRIAKFNSDSFNAAQSSD